MTDSETTHYVTDRRAAITRCSLPAHMHKRSVDVGDVTCPHCLARLRPLPPASDKGGTFWEGSAVFDKSRRR